MKKKLIGLIIIIVVIVVILGTFSVLQKTPGFGTNPGTNTENPQENIQETNIQEIYGRYYTIYYDPGDPHRKGDETTFTQYLTLKEDGTFTIEARETVHELKKIRQLIVEGVYSIENGRIRFEARTLKSRISGTTWFEMSTTACAEGKIEKDKIYIEETWLSHLRLYRWTSPVWKKIEE